MQTYVLGCFVWPWGGYPARALRRDSRYYLILLMDAYNNEVIPVPSNLRCIYPPSLFLLLFFHLNIRLRAQPWYLMLNPHLATSRQKRNRIKRAAAPKHSQILWCYVCIPADIRNTHSQGTSHQRPRNFASRVFPRPMQIHSYMHVCSPTLCWWHTPRLPAAWSGYLVSSASRYARPSTPASRGLILGSRASD